MNKESVILILVILIFSQCEGNKVKRNFFVTKKENEIICKGELAKGDRMGYWNYQFDDCLEQIKWKKIKCELMSFYVSEDWKISPNEPSELINATGEVCKNWTQLKLVQVPFEGKIPKDINLILKDHLVKILILNYKKFEVIEAYDHNKQSWFQHSSFQVEAEKLNAMHLYFVSKGKIFCLAVFFKGDHYESQKYFMFDFLTGMKYKRKSIFTIQQAVDYVHPDFDEYETFSETELR